MNISPRMRRRRSGSIQAVWVIVLLIMAIMPLCSATQAVQSAAGFEDGLKQLTQRSFNTKIKGLELIVASSDKRTQQVLSELLEGRLYYMKRRQAGGLYR